MQAALNETALPHLNRGARGRQMSPDLLLYPDHRPVPSKPERPGTKVSVRAKSGLAGI